MRYRVCEIFVNAPCKPWETCAVCANIPANCGRLARSAQTFRQIVGDLRGLRKRPVQIIIKFIKY
jgi:hypothetical protein